jgi:putative membrane protein
MNEIVRLKPDTVRALEEDAVSAQESRETAPEWLVARRTLPRCCLWIVPVLALAAMIVLVLLGESMQYVRMLRQTHVALAYAFATAVVLFAGSVVWWVVRSMRDYMRIGRIGCPASVCAALQSDADAADIRAYVQQLAARYERHALPAVRAGVAALRERMRVTEVSTDMLAELRAGVLAPLDAQAEEIIMTTALQTALGTAISPVAFIDAALVLWRGVVMVRRIACMYGNRPGVLGTWRLLGNVLATVAFAGVADLVADAAAQIVGGGIASRVSGAMAQGLSTGFLTMRLGIATQIVCRPLPLERREATHWCQLMANRLWQALRGSVAAREGA